jgi:chromosomal replication initiator protein
VVYLVETRSAQIIWQTALGEIQVQVSRPNFRTWFEKTTGLSYQDDTFTIGVPNTFVAEYLERNQRSLIEKTLIGITNKVIEVNFCVNGHNDKPHDTDIPSHKNTDSMLNPRYTFETFEVSDCNRLAHAAATSIAANPGLTFNPLFIYGGVGLGKTHLLHAIGHTAQAQGLDVIFVSAEHFTNDFIRSIREKKTDEFRNRYRNTDMLLVDDIQFICGKEQTEESFFHTFNELHNANRQIAVTCDCPPKSVPVIEERLRSRFEWGLTISIESPDRDARLNILQAKARRKGIEIACEILEYIAEQNHGNVRELEGSLNRVIAYGQLLKLTPTLEIAGKAMADIASKQPDTSPDPTPDHVLKLVADHFNSSVEALKSRKRDRQNTLARQIAMYLIRQYTYYSLERIGKELGNREPITVSNAYKKIATDLQSNPELRQRVLVLEQQISTACTTEPIL